MMLLKVLFVINCVSAISSNALPSNNERIESSDKKCGYEVCPTMKSDMLNVHIVAHSHDDVGWLKTVDQYYYGSKGAIQKAGVQYILDSVVEALLQHPNRRFIYVESAFFSKWWYEQTDIVKEQVKMLVNEGRLQFVGGAWSMNDEATTHYQSIVDQFTWGLRFLNDTFGACARPTIGWQVDPFGHSNTQASLFAKMGYDAVFFSRIDYQDKLKRMSDKKMEVVWKPSQNLNDTDILAGVLYEQWYNAPSGFCFDIVCNDEPIIDDRRSSDYNVERRVSEFVKILREYAEVYRSNNVMLTMGGDFTYTVASMYFKNLDKLMKYTNERQDELKINLFYSTPACYLKSLYDANIEWPTKSDDFFPYASHAHSYWTGYFTSRPSSKRLERVGNHFLQVCKKLSGAAKVKEHFYEENLNRLRSIMGVMQHHDAITGTEKQHVNDDYNRELHASIIGCEINTKSSMNQFITGKQPADVTTDWKFDLNSCLQLNISICETSELSEKFMVTVFNPLSHATNQYARFPVTSDSYEIRDPTNIVVTSQILPIPTSLSHHTNATNDLLFDATEVPAMGYKSYFVTRLGSTAIPTEMKQQEHRLAEIVTIGSDDFEITFDINGLLSEITLDGVSSNISQNFVYYTGADLIVEHVLFENQSSGAYIFRPEPETTDQLIGVDVQVVNVVRGDLMDEVHQVFNEWVSQVVRVYKTARYVEFEWLVGPIDIEDGLGKEIVSRYYTNIASASVFYTDSNGRDMMKRVRDHRETWQVDLQEKVAGNYYPINTKIAIEDDNYRLAILTDRSEGGSSLFDGTVDLMVHRRLVQDDDCGVEEALNETEHGIGLIVRGKHWLHFGRKTNDSPTLEAKERLHQNEIHMPHWLFFDNVSALSFNDWSNQYTKTYSTIGKELPANIYLMTFEPWKENSFLIRFEHIMEKDEDPQLSLPVAFNLAEIFPGEFKFAEVTLAANQWIQDLSRLHFRQEGTTMPTVDGGTVNESQKEKWFTNVDITINPMEIRTFIMSSLVDDEPASHGIKSQTVFKCFVVIVMASILYYVTMSS